MKKKQKTKKPQEKWFRLSKSRVYLSFSKKQQPKKGSKRKSPKLQNL